MPSFDIVSEIDTVELRHAVDNANREITTRFDFRNVKATFELKDEVVKLSAEADFQLKQMRDILRGNLTKRGIDVNSMESQNRMRLASFGTKTFSLSKVLMPQCLKRS